MKILIACDVDPVLPPVLSHPPRDDIWKCLDNLELLLDRAKGKLPPITWFIRSDESIRFSTGDFASGYTTRRSLWKTLAADGHELGWHMHLMSFNVLSGCFEFDPDPIWLSEACRALSAHYDVRSTRTGWDYGNNEVFRHLEGLGIAVDLSALPGALAWHSVGHGRLLVDWSRCPGVPYHPSADDYQRPGGLNLLEIPITQFPNSILGMARRLAMRLTNGCYSFSGMSHRTRPMSDRWDTTPISDRVVWAFYFHPEDLDGDGMDNFLRNLEYLREFPDAEFMTASAARQYLTRSTPAGYPRTLDVALRAD
jgi:hypothetical protein